MAAEEKTREKKNELVCTKSTTDGIQLKIRRYNPGPDNRARCPVILCHGVLANKHSLDFGEPDNPELEEKWRQYSLAAYLYQEVNDVKFDVWVPELRGRRSYRDTECDTYPDTPSKYRWCVDHYIEYDAPVIVDRVRQAYDYTVPVFWVGMSMGGMVAYGYGQQQHADENLQGVVTIGSPASFEYNENPLFELLSRVIAPRKVSTMFNFKEIMERFPEVKEKLIETGANLKNVDNDIFEQYIQLGFDNYLSSKILSHFAVFFRHNNFVRYPRCPWVYDVFDKLPLIRRCIDPYSYKENLFKFKAPILALAGGADQEAPPKEVKDTIRRVGSTDVTYCEFSKHSELTDVDYGHLDFHKGKLAKDEVYPLIYKWLRGRDEEYRD